MLLWMAVVVFLGVLGNAGLLGCSLILLFDDFDAINVVSVLSGVVIPVLDGVERVS